MVLVGITVVLSSAKPLSLHDFHTSLTQMQFNPKEKGFEISVRLFTDDLEKALSRETGQKIQITSKPDTDPVIEKYIRKHLSLTDARKQRRPFTYIGHEAEGDANWVYLEMPVDGALKSAEMQQDVLMDLFDDQVNLVNVQVNSQRKTYVFRKNQPVQDVVILQ
ncbi:MAG: hypothetical protein H7Z72_19545 [Bacteroidetes bacterium]|nr:hypothetical protein [Fibrella sp.]